MTDVQTNFAYHEPKGLKIELHELVRGEARHLADVFQNTLPESREASLAMTKLEEALMWANASVARY